jgi:hypothetical protein
MMPLYRLASMMVARAIEAADFSDVLRTTGGVIGPALRKRSADKSITLIALEIVAQLGAKAPQAVAAWPLTAVGAEAAKLWREIADETHRIYSRCRPWLPS